MILLAKEVSSLGLAFYVCSPSKTNCGSRSPKKVIDCAYKDLHKYVQTRHSGQKHSPKVLNVFLKLMSCFWNVNRQIFFSKHNSYRTEKKNPLKKIDKVDNLKAQALLDSIEYDLHTRLFLLKSGRACTFTTTNISML